MGNSLIVPETDILMATVIYLVERGVIPYQFSVPRGKGIDTDSTKKKLENALKINGVSPTFSNIGADILAISEKEWWHIECKGAGSGTAQTQRTNFDRALSSVVSYYGEESSRLLEQYPYTVQYLGLSLPATDLYLRELIRRVRQPLRKRLNLWILLYDIKTKKIRCIEPNQDIEFIA